MGRRQGKPLGSGSIAIPEPTAGFRQSHTPPSAAVKRQTYQEQQKCVNRGYECSAGWMYQHPNARPPRSPARSPTSHLGQPCCNHAGVSSQLVELCLQLGCQLDSCC